MADLATALQTALNKTKESNMQSNNLKQTIDQWDKGTPDSKPEKHHFNVTNNVSRTTFELVKANPGCTRGSIIEIATKQKFNPSSVSSLLAQFIRVGHIRKDVDGRLYVTKNEFEPIKHKALKKAQTKYVKDRKKQKRAAIAALKEIEAKRKAEINTAQRGTRAEAKPARIVEAKPIQPLTTTATPTPASLSSFDADQLLSTLSFTQAITLYKKLKLMLGEV